MSETSNEAAGTGDGHENASGNDETTAQRPATGESDLGDAGKRALDALRGERNAANSQVKALQKELDKLKTQAMTDSERAVAAAKAEGRAEGLTANGKRLARAEFRAAAASAGVDVSALLEDIDVTRYIGDDGEPDGDAIEKAVQRFAVLVQPGKPKGDIAQGPRGTSQPTNMNDLIRRQAGVR